MAGPRFMGTRTLSVQIMLVISVLCAGRAMAAATLTTQRVASGLTRPIFVCQAPGDNNRLFIAEQHSGQIKILNLTAGTINASPFLTVTGLTTGGEQGLLGLAFHPNYQTNGFFYVNYTTSGGGASGHTAIVRFTRTNADSADAASAQVVLNYDQPQSNHNGGWIGFGADGYLYIASGDGGSSNDSGSGHTATYGNSQDVQGNLLGKMLRIDVNSDGFPADANKNYAIPSGNPFTANGGLDEIWAYGLRNPWRCSIDRSTGDLWIGDVGQGAREEIDFGPSGAAGRNYGWRIREGFIAGPGASDPVAPLTGTRVDPVHDYDHSVGVAVVGGYRYRGSALSGWQGVYFFGEYSNHRIWSFDFNGTAISNHTERTSVLGTGIGNISSFGEDNAGELYIVDYAGGTSGAGEVYKIVPALAISTNSPLAAWTVNTAGYSQTLAASNGTTPYSWVVSAGALPSGLTLSTGGVISGTPTATGTFNFTARVTDNASTQATKAFEITINAALAISTGSPLPAGNVGVVYSQTFAATGGTGGRNWTLSAGTLPNGLTLSNSGVLAGTPTAANTFNFTVRATDSAGASVTKAFAVTIANALAISTNSPLAPWTAGVAYSQPLSASGGSAPYTWNISAGALPAGLSLSSSGLISGTPTASGTADFTARVVDNGATAVTKPLSLTINPALSITTASPLPGAGFGAAYSQALQTSGGTGAFAWSVSDGVLPAGLTLDSAGVLSGTPSASGNFDFTVKADDSVGASAAKAFSLFVSGAPQIISTPLTQGNLGVLYIYDVDASGSPAPAYSLIGNVPAGMTIDAGSGVISWSPVAAGTFTVTVQASNGSPPDATQTFDIVVAGYGLPSRLPVSPFLNMPQAPDGNLPQTLSGTGAFSNVSTLTPGANLIPYNVNSPLWSDGAHKERWIALPNDGAPYDSNERIAFSITGEWTFPAGTVLVKHFELNTDERDPSIRKRLETRLLTIQADGSPYGVTYKWNDAGTEASLLPDSLNEEITITAADGSTRTQTWYYPSRGDCLTCHNTVSGGVLGVKTRQLNGDATYPSTGVRDNQLRTWSNIGMFASTLNEVAIPNYPKLVPLSAANESLENRVRSYIDSNCSQCHRPGGAPTNWDARFSTPLFAQNIVNGTVNDVLGTEGARNILPGDVLRSVMHRRVDSLDAIKMPPLARNVRDAQFVETLTAWIGSLAPNTTPVISGGGAASSGPVFSGQSVQFSVTATNASTWLWNFGDNTASTTPNTASHVYAAPGNYLVTVTISGPAGTPASTAFNVVVISPQGDSDGDGVEDTLELAAGTDPFDAGSVVKTAMTVSKLQGSANFKVAGKDSFSVSGVFPELPALFDPSDKSVAVNLGGARAVFVLDAKGRGKSDNGTIILRLKPSKRNKVTGVVEFLGGPVPFKTLLKNGAWAGAWADEGVNPGADASKTPMVLTAEIVFNGQVYSATVTATYSAKRGASGKFKK